MHTIARSPTVPPSSGAHTRKPLPMIEANGVTVARQLDDRASRREKARKPASKIATITTTTFNTLVCRSAARLAKVPEEGREDL